MKVTFKYNIGTYSGTLNEMTYGNYRDGMVCIGRKWVVPAVTPQQTSLGSVTKNLAELYSTLTVGYKADLKTYAIKYGVEEVAHNALPPTAYAIFVKLMYAFQKSDPEHVDLITVTKADLELLNAAVLTIKDTVDGGFLPAVNGYDSLTQAM